MGCTSGHPWRTEHAPPTRGAINLELPRAASPPPAWSQPAAAKETAHKGRRAETGAQNPKGAWPPGRPSARPARWASPPLLSCVLADTEHSPADRGAGSLKISGAAVTTEESRGPSAVTPFTGGHLGFGAHQRRPGSQRQQRSTDGSLGVRDELPGWPVTGVRPHGGKVLTVSGMTASCARGAGRRGAPGVLSTHTPGTVPALSRREATLSDTSAPQPGSGVGQWDARGRQGRRLDVRTNQLVQIHGQLRPPQAPRPREAVLAVADPEVLVSAIVQVTAGRCRRGIGLRGGGLGPGLDSGLPQGPGGWLPLHTYRPVNVTLEPLLPRLAGASSLVLCAAGTGMSPVEGPADPQGPQCLLRTGLRPASRLRGPGVHRHVP